MMKLHVVCLTLLLAIGCGRANDPRINQLKSDFRAIGKGRSDAEIRQIIAEIEREYGESTHDEHGYPLYELRPWEKPKQPWSWTANEKPFIVRPARNQQSHIKTAPLVEHRYVEIYYPNTSDVSAVESAVIEVWRHFANELQERHPQAHYKMVTVLIYVDDQQYDVPAGRATNEASRDLPDEPVIEWNEWNISRLDIDSVKP